MKYVGTEKMAGWTDGQTLRWRRTAGQGHFCPERKSEGHSFAKTKKWMLALPGSCFLDPPPQPTPLTLISSVRLVIPTLSLASVPPSRRRKRGKGGAWRLCDSIVTLKHVCMQITAEYLQGLFSSAGVILDKYRMPLYSQI